MSVSTSVRAIVTNIGRGGRWAVIQTITVESGPYNTQAEAEAVADRIANDASR